MGEIEHDVAGRGEVGHVGKQRRPECGRRGLPIDAADERGTSDLDLLGQQTTHAAGDSGDPNTRHDWHVTVEAPLRDRLASQVVLGAEGRGRPN